MHTETHDPGEQRRDDGENVKDHDLERGRYDALGLAEHAGACHQIGAQWNITTAARRWTEIEAIVPLAADK
jgi:hypothetical protein